MNTWKKGFVGLQALLVTASMTVASLLVVPTYHATSQRAAVGEAMTLATDLQEKLTRWFEVTGKFPTSNRHASVMVSPRLSKPDFIRDLMIQPDRTGQTVTIRVFLKEGVVANPTGERQFVYIFGSAVSGDQNVIEWQCGGAGLVSHLLPEECRA